MDRGADVHSREREIFRTVISQVALGLDVHQGSAARRTERAGRVWAESGDILSHSFVTRSETRTVCQTDVARVENMFIRADIHGHPRMSAHQSSDHSSFKPE